MAKMNIWVGRDKNIQDKMHITVFSLTFLLFLLSEIQAGSDLIDPKRSNGYLCTASFE